MAPRAARRTLPVPMETENNSYAGPDPPSKQLNLEASGMGHSPSKVLRDADGTLKAARASRLEDAPDFLKQNGTNSARDKSSVDILRAAAGRRASKKLVAPRKNYVDEERFVKPKKSGQAAYDIPSDDGEEDGEDGRDQDHGRNEDEDKAPELPSTPMVTRAAAAKASASPESARRTRGASYARSPQQPKPKTQFSRRDDEMLLQLVNEGLDIHNIEDSMPQFTKAQLQERSAVLFYAHQERQNKAQEEASEEKPAAKFAGKQAVRAEKAQFRKWAREEEDELILAWRRQKDWDVLREICPGRTDTAITSRYYMLENMIKDGKRADPHVPKTKKRKADALDLPKKRAKSGRGRAHKDSTPPVREASQELGDSAQNEPATAPGRNAGNAASSPIAARKVAPTAKRHRRTRSNATVDEDIEAQKVSIPETVQEEDEHDPDAALPSTEEEHEGEELEEVDLLANEDTLALINGGVDGEAHVDHVDNAEDRGVSDKSAAAEPPESPKPPIMPTNLDLYGQRDALKTVLSAVVKHINETFKAEFKGRAKKETPQIEAIRHNKERLDELFKRLSQTTHVHECREGIDKHVERLRNQLKHIDPDREVQKTAKMRYVRMMNIFIPADVLRILRAAVEAYALEKPTEDSVEKWYLVTWLTIAESLTEFYTRSRAWKDYSFVGVRDIRSSLLVPLTKIVSAWRKALKTFNKTLSSQRRVDRDEEEARLGRDYDDKFRRLSGLFIYRQIASRSPNAASGKFKMAIKKQHEWRAQFRPNDDNEGEGAEPEIDANGNVIERVELFEHRTRRPHPLPLTQATDDRPWTDHESRVLLAALRDLHGSPHLFKELVENYCQPGDPLAKRTIPEILRHVKTFVDAYPRTITDEEGEEVVQEAPAFLKDIGDLDLIELLV